ncbi:hypothetical protein [Providencia hangzhouensis]|uniref:hypothetical protein n=1 Tax=Providencia hangzhouensis TaxID=3031799 RepID=UPI0034DCD33B
MPQTKSQTSYYSGQWHRHYDTVVVSSSSNDKQVELLRHYLELTGGSLLIIENDDVPPLHQCKNLSMSFH